MGIIKRQGIKNTISGYVGILIGFANLIIIQPYFLSKEELGLTRLLYSFSLLIAMFVPMGIGNATMKYFPLFKEKEKGHHGYFSFMNLFPLAGFIISAIIIYALRNFILNQYRTESPLFLEYFNYVFPLIFFNSFIYVFTTYCYSHLKSTVPSYLNDIVVRLLTIVVVSIYFLRWVNFDQFIALFVSIYAIQLLILLFYIFSFDKPVFKIDWTVLREKKIYDLIRFGFLMWFASIASLSLKYFDSIMVGKFMPLAYVGIYTVAAFIPTVIEAPLNAFEKIAAAKIAYAWSANDRTQIESIYAKSTLYLFLIGGFIFLNVNANIHTLLTFLPSGYEGGEIVVIILSIGTLFNMATGLNAPVLFNSSRYRYGAVFLIILAVLILILQMLFIPRYGIAGAALATGVSALVYNSMLYISVYKFFHIQPFNRKNLLVLMMIIVTSVVIFFSPHLENRYADIAFRTAITSGLYISLAYIFKIAPEVRGIIDRIRK
jgi:O-antigen/teichoic acid export membrane protein